MSKKTDKMIERVRKDMANRIPFEEGMNNFLDLLKEVIKIVEKKK